MKTVILFFFSVFSVTSFVAGAFGAVPSSEALKAALERQTKCENFVRFDDRYIYLGFGEYQNAFENPRHPIPGSVHVAAVDGSESFELATKDAAIDAVSDAGHLFVLTYTSIEEWDLASHTRVAEYSTYDHAGPYAYQEEAQAMARYRDTLVIAHGRLGVSFFDLKRKRLVNQYRLVEGQLPLESMATGVTVQGALAYVVMDNFTIVKPGLKPAFRGIVTIDMSSDSVVGEFDGLDPGADAIVSNSTDLIVSFMGQPLWKYSLSDFQGNATPSPRGRLWTFPTDGHPLGRPYMDDTYYYTCFAQAPQGHGGMYHRVPLALERQQLKWN